MNTSESKIENIKEIVINSLDLYDRNYLKYFNIIKSRVEITKETNKIKFYSKDDELLLEASYQYAGYYDTNNTCIDPILDYTAAKNISYNDTSIIYNLTPKTYTYNSDSDAGTQIGYIAEDVIEIHPNFTTYNSCTYTNPVTLTPVAINYDVITVFAVEELK